MEIEEDGGEEFELVGVGLRAFRRGAVGGFGGGVDSGGLTNFGLAGAASLTAFELLSSPLVLMPPSIFRNFGIPTPANIPPS